VCLSLMLCPCRLHNPPVNALGTKACELLAAEVQAGKVGLSSTNSRGVPASMCLYCFLSALHINLDNQIHQRWTPVKNACPNVS
jgi:hypothetical protein